MTAPAAPGSALYARSGSIVLAGALVLLAGAVQLVFGLWLIASYQDQFFFEEDRAFVALLGKIVFVFGLAALAVGVGVMRVRPWARWCAILYGVVSVLLVALFSLRIKSPEPLLQPAVSNVVLFLLLRKRVGEAFREAADAHRERRTRARQAVTSVRARG